MRLRGLFSIKSSLTLNPLEPTLPKPKGRHFKIDGLYYPGVSTILRATQSYEKIQALRRWRERVGTVEAQRITQEATSRGSLVHKLAETLLKGDDAAPIMAAATPEQQTLATPFWEQVQTIIPALHDPFLIEAVVAHPIGHYAGVIDLACYWEDELGRYPVVLDWKTSSKPKRTEYLEDYFLQLTAYGAALNRSQDLKIQWGILIVSSPETTQVCRVHLKDHFRGWLDRLHRFWQEQDHHPVQPRALAALREHYGLV